MKENAFPSQITCKRKKKHENKYFSIQTFTSSFDACKINHDGQSKDDCQAARSSTKSKLKLFKLNRNYNFKRYLIIVPIFGMNMANNMQTTMMEEFRIRIWGKPEQFKVKIVLRLKQTSYLAKLF